MITRVFSQFKTTKDSYRIVETLDSVSIQKQTNNQIDSEGEWITVYAAARTKDGFKSCLIYFRSFILSEQRDADKIWEQAI